MFRFLPLLLLAGVLPFVESLVAQPPLKAEVRKPVKVAVLIGTNDYTDAVLDGLKFCEKDMLKLKDALEPLGFKVILLLGSGQGDAEATRRNILDALVNDAETNAKYAFRDIVAADDIALVAFSGHGQQIVVKVNDKEMEVPFYCPKRAKSGVPETQVSLNDVLGKLNGGKAHSLLLVDACREYTERKEPDGQKSAKGLSLDRSVINGLRRNVGGMFACDDRQRAMEHEVAGGGHGLFFFSVLDALRTTPKDDDGVVTWEDLVPRIRKQVTALTAKVPNLDERDRQKPQSFGNFNASVVLVPKAEIVLNEKIEAFTWKGEKRTRAVRTLKYGEAAIEFVKVPKGSFTMGSPEDDKKANEFEKPQHKVTFTKDLWVGKYPVTRAQFAAFVTAKGYKTECETNGTGSSSPGFSEKGDWVSSLAFRPEWNWRNPGWEQAEDSAVTNVSWNDTEAFAAWFGRESKLGIRLLTEAEYEYATRGGTNTQYITGDDEESHRAHHELFSNTRTKQTMFKVGLFLPNGYGLHDMVGNVSCWCLDKCDGKPYSGTDRIDPVCLDVATENRLVRNFVDHRSADRVVDTDPKKNRLTGREPSSAMYSHGFRICFREGDNALPGKK